MSIEFIIVYILGAIGSAALVAETFRLGHVKNIKDVLFVTCLIIFWPSFVVVKFFKLEEVF